MVSFTAVFDDLRVDASAGNVDRLQVEFQALILREAMVAPDQERPLLQMEVVGTADDRVTLGVVVTLPGPFGGDAASALEGLLRDQSAWTLFILRRELFNERFGVPQLRALQVSTRVVASPPPPRPPPPSPLPPSPPSQLPSSGGDDKYHVALYAVPAVIALGVIVLGVLWWRKVKAAERLLIGSGALGLQPAEEEVLKAPSSALPPPSALNPPPPATIGYGDSPYGATPMLDFLDSHATLRNGRGSPGMRPATSEAMQRHDFFAAFALDNAATPRAHASPYDSPSVGVGHGARAGIGREAHAPSVWMYSNPAAEP